MCGRYALYSANEAIAAALGMKGNVGNGNPQYNIPPGSYPPNVNTRLGNPAIESFLWGFKPTWAKADAPRPINARAEKVGESPYFRHAFAKQRCLVPANGWFEWKREGRTKIPHYLTHRDGELLFFAGIFEVGEGGAESSFAIITQPAFKGFREIHDRMPLALDPASWDAWLDTKLQDRDTIRRAVRAIAPEALHAYPVSSAVNKPGNNGPELIEVA